MKRLIERYGATLRADWRDRILQDSLTVLLNHLSQMLLGLVSSAFLARGLGPTGLGIFSVMQALIMITGTVADLGLSGSAVRQIAAEEADGGETTAVYTRLKVGSSLFFVLLLVILAQPIGDLLNLPAATARTLVWMAAFTVLAMSLSRLVGTLLRAIRRFRPLVVMQLLNTGLTVALMGGFFLMGALTILPALWIGAVTALVSAGVGVFLLPHRWRVAMWATVRSSTGRRQLLAFSRWLWLSAILSILFVQLDVLLLNQRLPVATVGIYALAANLVSKAGVINRTWHTVLLPVASALKGRLAYQQFVRRNLWRSSLVAGGIVLLLPLIRPFVLLLYGPAYAASIPIFYGLMGVVLMEMWAGPVLLLAYPLNMPRLLAASDGLRVSLFVMLSLWLMPQWGVYGLVVAKVIAKVCSVALAAVGIWRNLDN